MINKTLEALRFTNNGKLDVWRIAMFGVPLALFLLWRLSGDGVSDSDRILKLLEEEIINNYKQALYKEYGFYENDIADNPKAKDFPHEELLYLDVTFRNVSFAAPLLSFSATEQVSMHYDYQLRRDGIIKEQDKGVYTLVKRHGGINFWPGDPFTHYLQYF